MKKTLILFKGAYRDGHHLNSKYWQEWKKQLPALPSELTEVAVGMVLKDALLLHNLIKPYVHSSMAYKIPKV